MYIQKVISRNFFLISFLLASLRSMAKIAGYGSISQRHGSADPDPYQNVMDPQHLFIVFFIFLGEGPSGREDLSRENAGVSGKAFPFFMPL
jgi:hypothetical protein